MFADSLSTVQRLLRILASISPMLRDKCMHLLVHSMDFPQLAMRRILRCSEDDLKLEFDKVTAALSADIQSSTSLPLSPPQRPQ